jgi:GT2 family glycosyltransferase
MKNIPLITISIVSHKQALFVHKLLEDLQQHCASFIEVILTLNVEELLPFESKEYSFPITLIRNSKPKGFGTNHNAAFGVRKGLHFCIMNPDVSLSNNPFPYLIDHCIDENIGVVAPLVTNQKGTIEKSARYYPTLASLLAKLLGFDKADYSIGEECFFPDWVAGMFMLFPSNVFKAIGGFDERYFLYYEDLDLCARLWCAGYKVVFCPSASIIHDARRDSHRNLKYMRWHLTSMARFFMNLRSGKYNKLK